VKKPAYIYTITALLLISLVVLRAFEKNLFHDPLLSYFANDKYLTRPLPVLSRWHYVELLVRYILVSTLSILILIILFPRLKIKKSLVILYAFTGLVLLILFMLSYRFYDHLGYRPLFYIRRILTQPVLLFILLPILFFLQKFNPDNK